MKTKSLYITSAEVDSTTYPETRTTYWVGDGDTPDEFGVVVKLPNNSAAHGIVDSIIMALEVVSGMVDDLPGD